MSVVGPNGTAADRPDGVVDTLRALIESHAGELPDVEALRVALLSARVPTAIGTPLLVAALARVPSRLTLMVRRGDAIGEAVEREAMRLEADHALVGDAAWRAVHTWAVVNGLEPPVAGPNLANEARATVGEVGELRDALRALREDLSGLQEHLRVAAVAVDTASTTRAAAVLQDVDARGGREENASRAVNDAEELERAQIERDGGIESKRREAQARDVQLRRRLEAWRHALREGRLALVVRDGDGSAAEDPEWRQTVTAMADAWVALRDARQNDDERKETEDNVSRFLMAFTTIDPLSGAWLRFDHVRAEGKRVGMAVTVPVQSIEGALKNRLDVRWLPLFDRLRPVARELPPSELAALGPTVAQEREATLVALAAEVGALRQEFDRWPTLTPQVTVMGPMTIQLGTLEKATTQVRALRERQAALRATWDAAGDDVALQVAVLDEAAREKVRFYDAPEDLPAALGAQFRQALRITVPAQVPTTTQVPTSATAPRTNGQATAAPETRVVTQVNPRQFAETLQSVQGVESLPVASLPKRDTVTPPSERLAPSAAPEVDPVQRLVQSVDAMVGANSRREVEREAWLEACRQERALARGRESDPTLKQLRRVRDRLVGAANANALRWGTEAFFEGGSELGRAVISEVRLRADELMAVAGTDLRSRQRWVDWDTAIAKRESLERLVADVRENVLDSASLRRAIDEFDRRLNDTITANRDTDWASDVWAWLTIMRVHLGGTYTAAEAERLRDLVNRRLKDGHDAVPKEELLSHHQMYLEHLSTKAAQIIATLERRSIGKAMTNPERGQLCAWRRLQARPGDDWFAAFAANVAKR